VVSLREKLQAGEKSLIGNKGYRRYLCPSGPDHFQIDEAKIVEEARYDGKWVLRTNTDLDAAEVALQYKRHWMVESYCRSCKSLLQIQKPPVQHLGDALHEREPERCVVSPKRPDLRRVQDQQRTGRLHTRRCGHEPGAEHRCPAQQLSGTHCLGLHGTTGGHVDFQGYVALDYQVHRRARLPLAEHHTAGRKFLDFRKRGNVLQVVSSPEPTVWDCMAPRAGTLISRVMLPWTTRYTDEGGCPLRNTTLPAGNSSISASEAMCCRWSSEKSCKNWMFFRVSWDTMRVLLG